MDSDAPSGRCPKCGASVLLISPIGLAPPPGGCMLTVCTGCAALLAIGADLQLRDPTDAEIDALPGLAAHNLQVLRDVVLRVRKFPPPADR